MKKISFLFSLVLLLTFSACQKVIDMPLADSEPKLVIDAKYDAVKEEVVVKVSKTIGVFSTADYAQVTGAMVSISDENGVVTPLIDQGNGMYLLENYPPVFNSTYTLSVTTEGTTYIASDQLPPIVPLDSLTMEYQPPSPFLEEGYLVTVKIDDPVGSNFYRINRIVNGERKALLSQPGESFLLDDALNDGNQINLPLYPVFYQLKDTVQIDLISYSEQSYTYFQELAAIANGASNSAAPANPTSVWSNECIGVFTTYGYDTKTIIIKE